MTVPSYTEDLTDISLADEDPGTTSWTELTGTDQDGETYNVNGAPAGEDDEVPYIQGSFAVTQDCTKDTSIGSLAFDAGGITVPTDGAIFVWHNFSSAFAFGTYAQGGYRICIGSGLGDFDVWYTGGNNTGRMPYGGFENHVVNPTITRDNWAGTATGTLQWVGSAVYILVGPSKGEVHQVDAMRYGRGSSIFEYGEAADYAIIDGFALENDLQINRWGLIQAIPGGYLWKGKMQLGSVANAVDFRDSNVTIFIDWTPKVTANFNTIDIVNAGSNIEMTGFQFIQLDTSTASKGRWITTDDATVVLTNCVFNDMSTFVFDSNSVLDTVTWRRCELVTQGAGDFDDCLFDEPSGSIGFHVEDLDLVDNCDFISDGTGYAIELDSGMAGNSYTMSGCAFTGYAGVDGSTGNECIYNNTGGTVTIAVGTGQTPTVHDVGISSTVITSSVDLYVIVKDEAGDPIENVQVGIFKSSDGTEIKNQDTDAQGEVDTSYTGSVPEDVYVRCRKASSGTTKYINYASEQTIAAITGLSLSVTLKEDTNNNATT